MAEAALARAFPELAPAVRAHLVLLYGTHAADVLAPAEHDPSLLSPLHPDGPDLVAQALYAGTHEWALRPEDIVFRRATLGLRGLASPDVVARSGSS